jgi:hypothetical protein
MDDREQELWQAEQSGFEKGCDSAKGYYVMFVAAEQARLRMASALHAAERALGREAARARGKGRLGAAGRLERAELAAEHALLTGDPPVEVGRTLDGEPITYRPLREQAVALSGDDRIVGVVREHDVRPDAAFGMDEVPPDETAERQRDEWRERAMTEQQGRLTAERSLERLKRQGRSFTVVRDVNEQVQRELEKAQRLIGSLANERWEARAALAWHVERLDPSLSDEEKDWGALLDYWREHRADFFPE